MSLTQSVALLRATYPRQEFPDDSVRSYVHFLRVYDETLVAQAVSRLVRRSKWLPSIAEICDEVAELALGLPAPDEAWSMITKGESNKPAVVREAYLAVGGPWALKTTERPEMLRRAFREEYLDRRQRALATYVENPRPQLEGEDVPQIEERSTA